MVSTNDWTKPAVTKRGQINMADVIAQPKINDQASRDGHDGQLNLLRLQEGGGEQSTSGNSKVGKPAGAAETGGGSPEETMGKDGGPNYLDVPNIYSTETPNTVAGGKPETSRGGKNGGNKESIQGPSDPGKRE